MDWQMMTLVGEDRLGIVSRVTDALYRGGCSLGETSMMRLGGNFTIMMMVSAGDQPLETLIAQVADELQLQVHIDPIRGELHQHRVPNFQVRVVGADRAGIVAGVTGALAESGFNVLELESDVAGSAEQPVYIMTIQGYSEETLERLQSALDGLGGDEIELNISPIETLIG